MDSKGNLFERVPLSLEARLKKLSGMITELELLLARFQREGNESTLYLVNHILRVLLAYKGQNKPLLIDLAHEIEVPLDVYGIRWNEEFYQKRVANFGSGVNQVILPAQSVSISSTPFFKPMTIEAWLDDPQTVIDGVKITGRSLIYDTASAEGSHIDTSLPRWLVRLKEFGVGGYPAYGLAILTLGQVVVSLGHRVLDATGKDVANHG
ncbi:MAG: hypothetical protein HY261_06100 [Chloroflexi bacterium]|nr:hypothetical protein [Chloroflexota bacterium]